MALKEHEEWRFSVEKNDNGVRLYVYETEPSKVIAAFAMTREQLFKLVITASEVLTDVTVKRDDDPPEERQTREYHRLVAFEDEFINAIAKRRNIIKGEEL